MKLTKLLSVAVFSALMILPVASNAGLLSIRISDGINPDLIINDNGPGDELLQLGVVKYSGGFGDWLVTLGLGSSNYDPLNMHLTSAVTYIGGSTGSGAGVGKLHIDMTQTGLSVPGGGPALTSFTASGGGIGDGTATWTAYADGGNNPFGTTNALYTGGFPTSSGGATESLSTFYSASIFTTFDFTGLDDSGTSYQSSLDLRLKVPEPTSIALVGIALLALGAVTRRKMT